MAIDDNTSYELTGYQVKDLAGRIRRKAEASSVPTSISDLGQVTSSDIDWSTMPGSYSTTEQTTPFTWIDGKPIYKKTVNIGSLPNTATKTVAHGVTSIGTVIDAKGSAIRSTDSVWFLIPNTPNPLVGNVNIGIGLTVSSSSIEISTGADRTNMSGYVTIWYTKTTD